MWVTLVLVSGLTGALCAPSNPNVRAVSMDTIIADFFRQGDKDNDGIYSLAEAWTEILAMDRDGDKKVSLAEYTARLHSIEPSLVPEAPNFFAKEDMNKDGYIDQQDVNKIYALVDTDGNGQVTMLEFSVFIKKFFGDLGFGTTIPTPTGFTSIVDPRIEALFNFTDKNADGLISLDELWAQNLLMDTNGNKRIEFNEFYAEESVFVDSQAFVTAQLNFNSSDLNGNGYLDKSDLKHVFDQVDINGDGYFSLSEYDGYYKTPFSVGGNITRSTDQEILDLFHSTDTNGDGFISLDEQWARSSPFDINGDGRISFEEFAVFIPDKTLADMTKEFAQNDFNNDHYIDKEDILQILEQADLNGDGRMSLSEYIQFDRPIFQQATPGPTGTPRPLNTVFDDAFHRIDTDGSGKINFNEYLALFLTTDSNGDGRVSWAEYMYIKNETNDPTELARSQAEFRIFDIDKNDFLEEKDLRKSLKDIDTDGDGEINKSEYINYTKQIFANLGTIIEGFTAAPGSLVPLDLSLAQSFRATDTDGNGTISFDEQWAAILRFDKNGDNRINLEEYLGNSTGEGITFEEALFREFDYDNSGYFDVLDIRLGFDVLDTDSDGQVSEAEYVGFLKQFLTNLGVVVEGYTPAPNSSVSLESSLIRAFHEADTDGNGIISFEEQWNQTIILDKNGDNKVSLTEYLASYGNASSETLTFGQKIFKHFDYNHDGYFEENDIREGIHVLDYDADGSVTQNEYVGYLKRLFQQFGVTIPSVSIIPTTPAS